MQCGKTRMYALYFRIIIIYIYPISPRHLLGKHHASAKELIFDTIYIRKRM